MSSANKVFGLLPFLMYVYLLHLFHLTSSTMLNRRTGERFYVLDLFLIWVEMLFLCLGSCWPMSGMGDLYWSVGQWQRLSSLLLVMLQSLKIKSYRWGYISYIWVMKLKKKKKNQLALTWKLHPYWLAFIVVKGAMHLADWRRREINLVQLWKLQATITASLAGCTNQDNRDNSGMNMMAVTSGWVSDKI